MRGVEHLNNAFRMAVLLEEQRFQKVGKREGQMGQLVSQKLYVSKLKFIIALPGL